jgi:hypothetical protein
VDEDVDDIRLISLGYFDFVRFVLAIGTRSKYVEKSRKCEEPRFGVGGVFMIWT